MWFGVACDKEKVFATSFGFCRPSVLRRLIECLPFGVPFQYSEKKSPLAELVLNLVKDIFYGNEIKSAVPLALNHLSKYSQDVIKVVSQIPIGYVTSYSSVTTAAGGSARAAGQVMARNPFAPIIPCHRVVCFDFALGGYSYGQNVKLELLKREDKGYTDEKELQVGGKSLKLFPIVFVLKKAEK